MRITGRRELIDEDGSTNWHHHNGDEVIPPLCQLEAFLDKWSSSPSLDQSEPVDELYLHRLVITRPLIHRLLPLLRHNQQDDHILLDHSAGTTTNSDIPVLKFNHAYFYCCCFKSEGDTTMADKDDDVCTPEDKLSFLSAIARLRGSLKIARSREILSGLLSFPEIDHLEGKNFSLFQHTQLSESEFVRLGALIQRSVQTTQLVLTIFMGNAPQEFYDGLANSIHIQELSFSHIRDLFLGSTIRAGSMLMSKLIAGEDGNGALERLLRNPQSQLIKLNLNNTYLEDHHLIAIGQLLPHSKVDTFYFDRNWIRSPGLLEFMRQIPNMRSLSAFSAIDNHWVHSIAPSFGEVAEEFWEEPTVWEATSAPNESTAEIMAELGEEPSIGTAPIGIFTEVCMGGPVVWKESAVQLMEEISEALLECVMKNHSITHLGGFFCILIRQTRLIPLICHYQSLNCGGRKILAHYLTQSQDQEQHTTGSPLPDGLWPHILARAGRHELYIDPQRWQKHNGPANAVYFFLQHVAGNLFGQSHQKDTTPHCHKRGAPSSMKGEKHQGLSK